MKEEKKSKFRCIDLYSGLGGWALGFKMAGINVVSSYEIWEPAASTQKLNLGGNVDQIDIKNAKLLGYQIKHLAIAELKKKFGQVRNIVNQLPLTWVLLKRKLDQVSGN